MQNTTIFQALDRRLCSTNHKGSPDPLYKIWMLRLKKVANVYSFFFAVKTIECRPMLKTYINVMQNTTIFQALDRRLLSTYAPKGSPDPLYKIWMLRLKKVIRKFIFNLNKASFTISELIDSFYTTLFSILQSILKTLQYYFVSKIWDFVDWLDLYLKHKNIIRLLWRADLRSLEYVGPTYYRLIFLYVRYWDPYFDFSEESDEKLGEEMYDAIFAKHFPVAEALDVFYDHYILQPIDKIRFLDEPIKLIVPPVTKITLFILSVLNKWFNILLWFMSGWFFWNWWYWFVSILPDHYAFDGIRNFSLAAVFLCLLGLLSPFAGQDEPITQIFQRFWNWYVSEVLEGSFFSSYFFNSPSDLFGFEVSSGFFPEFLWIWMPPFTTYGEFYSYYPTISAFGAPIAIPLFFYLVDLFFIRDHILSNIRYYYFREEEGMYIIPEMYDEETDEVTPATFCDYFDYYMGTALTAACLAGLQVDHFWDFLDVIPTDIHIASILNHAWDVPINVKDISRLRLNHYRDLYDKYSFTILTQVQHQVFLQTYLDVLQIRYGSSVGHFFYQTPHSSLSAQPFYFYKDVTQTVQSFSLDIVDSLAKIVDSALYEANRVLSPYSFTIQDYPGGESYEGTWTSWAIPDFLYHVEPFDQEDDLEWAEEVGFDVEPIVYGSYENGQLDDDDEVSEEDDDDDDMLWYDPIITKFFGKDTLGGELRYEDMYTILTQPGITPRELELAQIYSDHTYKHDPVLSVDARGRKQLKTMDDYGLVRHPSFYYSENFFDPEYGDSTLLYKSSWPYFSLYDEFLYAYKPYRAANLDFLEDLFFGKFSLDYFLILQQYLRPRIDTNNDFFANDLLEELEGVEHHSRRSSWAYHYLEPFGPIDHSEEDHEEDADEYPYTEDYDIDEAGRLLEHPDMDSGFEWFPHPDFIKNEINTDVDKIPSSHFDFIWESIKKEKLLHEKRYYEDFFYFIDKKFKKIGKSHPYVVGFHFNFRNVPKSPEDSGWPRQIYALCYYLSKKIDWLLLHSDLSYKPVSPLPESFMHDIKSGKYKATSYVFNIWSKRHSLYTVFSWTYSPDLLKKMFFSPEGLFAFNHFFYANGYDAYSRYFLEVYSRLDRNKVPFDTLKGSLLLQEVEDANWESEFEDIAVSIEGPWDEEAEFGSSADVDISNITKAHQIITEPHDDWGDFYDEEPRDVYYGNLIKKFISFIANKPYYPLNDQNLISVSVPSLTPYSKIWPFLRRFRHPYPMDVYYLDSNNVHDERRITGLDMVSINSWIQGILWDVPKQIEVGALHYAWPFAFDNSGLVPVEWFYSRLTRNDFSLNFSFFEWWTPSFRFVQMLDGGAPNWDFYNTFFPRKTWDLFFNEHLHMANYIHPQKHPHIGVRFAGFMNHVGLVYAAVQQLVAYRLSASSQTDVLPLYVDFISKFFIPNWQPVPAGQYFLHNECPDDVGRLHSYFLNFFESTSVDTCEYGFHLIRFINGYPFNNKMRGHFYNPDIRSLPIIVLMNDWITKYIKIYKDVKQATIEGIDWFSEEIPEFFISAFSQIGLFSLFACLLISIFSLVLADDEAFKKKIFAPFYSAAKFTKNLIHFVMIVLYVHWKYSIFRSPIILICMFFFFLA